MKIGILTFQFAHNYGAALQAYALRKHILQAGYEAELIPYNPPEIALQYDINPFAMGKSVKRRVKDLLTYPVRAPQAARFHAFQRERMALGSPFSTERALADRLRQYGLLIAGSDQVWNEDITGRTPAYFLTYPEAEGVPKMAYAASAGKGEAGDYMERQFQRALKDFRFLSVRDETTAKMIQPFARCPVRIVADPVFLLAAEEWEDLVNGARVDASGGYILYYALRHDDELIRRTGALSQSTGLPVRMIHPTLARQSADGRMLRRVGPLEFLALLRGAQCVCTNSFHAMAFSAIFSKKALHMPVQGLAGRVETLFKVLGVAPGADRIVNFAGVDTETKARYRADSERFLLESLREIAGEARCDR